ncbi:hypothetical protein PNOK_0903700 [Pyrrhoderma noxium]|uniref:Glutaminase A N-terminal domain-containing protein n=1 Tax=Pyrrhoderma noxium TaxID=2282107 RepID=A0A286U6S2_9AGAM|nr:hypothetical protein PNOK_0903700 [Pyrrhoderma noxium]
MLPKTMKLKNLSGKVGPSDERLISPSHHKKLNRKSIFRCYLSLCNTVLDKFSIFFICLDTELSISTAAEEKPLTHERGLLFFVSYISVYLRLLLLIEAPHAPSFSLFLYLWCLFSGLKGPKSVQINELWPRIWDNSVSDSLNVGWNAGIRVDGKAYNILGASAVANYTAANQTSVLFTPTRTSFLLTAGTVDVNMTFLSPIETHDLTRLSMPFSYLYLSATPNDNNPHEIQFYSDISGEWITGDSNFMSTWEPEELSDFVSLRMQLASEGKYQEIQNRP